MSKSRILILAGAFSLLSGLSITLLLRDPGAQGGGAADRDSRGAGRQVVGEGEMREVSTESLRVAAIIPADLVDSTHPVEVAVARGVVLSEYLEMTDVPGGWTRVRLVRSPIQPRLLRVVEEWSVTPDYSRATPVKREMFLADQLIVKVRDGIGIESLRRSLSDMKMTLGETLAPGLFTIRLPDATLEAVPEAITALDQLGDLILGVEADGVGFGAAAPNDSSFPSQWGNHNTGQSGGTVDADVDAPEFWAVSGHAPGIVIAVLDSGLNFSHPDLAGIAWTNPGEITGDGIDNDGNGRVDDVTGWDFVNSDNHGDDDHNHGTHVSGIIAAVRGNGTGIAGMLTGARILTCKILNSQNSGLTSNLIAATAYARLEGVPVMNLSLQNYPNSSLLSSEFDACAAAGIVLCVAAGNQGVNNDTTPNYPSSFPQANIISVGNHTRWDVPSGTSNYGISSVDLFAPGDSILSTVMGTGYSNFSGTSMATPYVAAVSAVLKYLNPAWGAAEIKAEILASAVPVPAYAGVSMSGARLNAANAVVEPSTFPGLTLEHPAGLSLDSGESSVSFGSAVMGGAGMVKTFIVGNSQIGTVLNIGSITVSGVNAGDFTIDTGSLDFSISGGESGTFSVLFSPVAEAARNAVLEIGSDDPDNPVFAVALDGVGSLANGPGQQIIIRESSPVTMRPDAEPFQIDAFASGGGVLDYEVLAGPATVDSSGVVTLNGSEGAVTLLVTQAGGDGYDPVETFVTFNVGTPQSYSKVVAGHSSWATFAIRDDGTLWTWGFVNGLFQLGDFSSGGRVEPKQIGTASNWTDLAMGNAFGMGLRADGTLWSWGSNSNGQLGDGSVSSKSSPVQIGAGRFWVSMSAGSSAAAAVADDGTLWAWGSNSAGQLGQGDNLQRTSPTQIGSQTNWSKVTCGTTFTLALNEAGEIWAWGSNTFGQLGQGDSVSLSAPTRVGVGTDWSEVVAGANHVLALKDDGSLWGWGNGSNGQLGNGNFSSRNVPTQAGGLKNWSSINAGFSTSAARKVDGSLWVWGSNTAGQLADGTTTSRNSPQRFGKGGDWAGIDTGNSHTVAWRNDGSVWVAGDSFGFSGARPRALARAIPPGGIWQHLAGTSFGFHAIREDGTLWQWGRSGSGLFGNGSTAELNSRTQLGTDTDWAALESGGHGVGSVHSLAIKENGTLRASGSNFSGQLGTGNTTSSTLFVAVDPASGAVWDRVAVGSSFSVGIRTNGTLWGWGLNSSSQLGQGVTANRLLPHQTGTASDWTRISCGLTFAAGIRSDGTLWTWGTNIWGQLGDGTQVPKSSPTLVGSSSDWVEVVCGANHVLALKSDGTLWAWGSNEFGQLGLGDTDLRLAPAPVLPERTWTRIVAGGNTSAAIGSDGTLWSAGDNSSGQTGGGGVGMVTTFSQVGSARGWQQVAVGIQNLVAIQADGSFWISGTTGSRVLGVGRRQTSLVALDPGLRSQTILPVTGTFYPGETVSFRASSGLTAEFDVVSGPGVEIGSEMLVNGRAPVVVRAWHGGDETAWDATPPQEVVITPMDELTLHFDSAGGTGVSVSGLFAGELDLALSLGYAPDLGDSLMLVDNTGSAPVMGTFPGLSQGAFLYLDYLGSMYGFRISYVGGDGNDVVISHEIAPQQLTVAQVSAKPTDHPAFELVASTTGGLPVSFEVIAGPATVLGNVITLTGQPGGVTLRVSQGGNDRFEATDGTLLTFLVGGWPAFTKIATSQSTWVQYAIHEDGTLWSWGYGNGLGQLGDTSPFRNAPLQVGTASDWIDIDVGGAFGMGLRVNGTLWSWGLNSNGQLGDGTTSARTAPVQVSSPKVWSSFTVGNAHAGAVATDGTLWIWGANSLGQLGLGDAVQRTGPIQVGSDADWSRVFCGGNFTIALKTNGELWGWGQNSNGQLGIGNLVTQNIPVRIGSDSDWALAEGGFSHVLAIKTNGELWGWGNNIAWQLGTGPVGNVSSPVRIGNDSDWLSLTGATSGSGATKTDGSLWIWGSNSAGQQSNGTFGNATPTPQRFLSGVDWVDFDIGSEHAFALSADGMIYAAGTGGGFSGVSPRALTKGAETGATWTQLSGTGVNFHAVRSGGTLWAWGRSGVGQMGNGSGFDLYTISRIGTESQWVDVRTGSHQIFSGASTFALRADGTLWGSGSNSSGQLGDGTTTQRTSFVQVGTNTNWSKVDTGTSFAMGVQSDGTLWGWGINGAYQLGQGVNINRIVPTRTGSDSNWLTVSCGRGHAVGIRTDGSLWAWGSNNFGQVGDATFSIRTVPVRIGMANDWAAVVCGSEHTMAIKTDGSLWAWGNNTFGQLGRGNRIHSSSPFRIGIERTWSLIAAGRNTSAAIATDGTLWTAGENHSGQAGTGGTADEITLTQLGSSGDWQHVAVGAHSLSAIKSDGSFWTAGTTGPRMLDGGRSQEIAAPILPAIVAQSINPPQSSYTIGEQNFTVTATSGLPVETRVVSGPAVANGDVIQFFDIGNVVIEAWSAGDEAVWNAALPERFTVIIEKNPADVNFSGLSHVYDGSAKFALATTNPEGLGVVITYDGSTTPPTSAGNYAAVATIDDLLFQGSASGTLTIEKASQTIVFNTIADQTANASVPLIADGGDSTQPVTFSVTGPAVIDGGNITFIGAGSVTVTASQNGDANYLAAPSVERTFQVTKAGAMVNLGNLSQTYDGNPKPVSATTSPEGKAVVITYGGSPSPPAGAGTYEVIGTIDDAIYQGSSVGTLVIAKAVQVIEFSAISSQIATAEVTLNASGGGSGNPVTYEVAGPAVLSGNVLSFTGAGEVSVTANLAGNSNYFPAASVVRTFQVTKAPATVLLELLSQTYDGGLRSVNATTTPAGLSVLFSYDGLPEPPVNAGAYEVIGTISDLRFEGSATGTLSVAKAAQTIEFPPIDDQLATALVTLSATGGGSGNAVIFAVSSGPATITGTQLAFSGPGTVIIAANQAGNSNFESAPTREQSIGVTAESAAIHLSRLHQVADGTVRTIEVETVPPGVETVILYDGTRIAPTAIGSYPVTVEVDDSRYEGAASATLIVDDPARVKTIAGGALPPQSSLGTLSVPTFQIGAYEVTAAQWNTIVGWAEANAGYQFDGAGSAAAGDHPVAGVNWYDAAKWCNARTEWENAIFGRSFSPAYTIEGIVFRSGSPTSPNEIICDFGTSGYRLPTASEWELAARGGVTTPLTIYPGGNVIDLLGWYSGNSGEARAVGGKLPNSAGIFDFAGNVSEWVWDAISGSPAQRGLRGGSWLSSASSSELAVFTGDAVDLRRADAGLRLVRSVSLGLQEALDHPDLSWESGVDHPWLAQQGESFVGGDVAKSPVLAAGQSAWVETRVTGPVNLHFRWRTSGLGAEDSAIFLVGETPVAIPESNGEWQARSVEIAPGDHFLRWRITSGSSPGTGRFWLDEVAYESATTPDLSLAIVSGVSGNSVTLSGEVISDGGRAVSGRGFVYATSPDPTLETTIALLPAGSGPGVFQTEAAGLSEGTTYYARAYATNNLGTGYGDAVRFTTDTSVNFIDGVASSIIRDLHPGDRQLFRFALTGPRFVNFQTTGNAALRAQLFDSEGNQIASFSEDTNFDIEELLLAGGYVLNVFREADGAPAQTFNLTIDASTIAASRPDLAVGASPAALSGVELYAPASQAAALISKKAKAVTGYASLSNRGNLPDVLAASATGGSALFAVSYFGPEGNITAGLLTGTYRTPGMVDSTEPVIIRASIAPNKKKLTKKNKGKKPKILKKTHVLSLRVNSTFDQGLSDAAVISVQTK